MHSDGERVVKLAWKKRDELAFPLSASTSPDASDD